MIPVSSGVLSICVHYLLKSQCLLPPTPRASLFFSKSHEEFHEVSKHTSYWCSLKYSSSGVVVGTVHRDSAETVARGHQELTFTASKQGHTGCHLQGAASKGEGKSSSSPSWRFCFFPSGFIKDPVSTLEFGVFPLGLGSSSQKWVRLSRSETTFFTDLFQ